MSSLKRFLTTGAARGKTARPTHSSPQSSRRNGMAPAPTTPTWPSDVALRKCKPERSLTVTPLFTGCSVLLLTKHFYSGQFKFKSTGSNTD